MDGGVNGSFSGCSEDPEAYSSGRVVVDGGGGGGGGGGGAADKRGWGSLETLDCTRARASSNRLILSIIHLASCFFSVPSGMAELDTLKDD